MKPTKKKRTRHLPPDPDRQNARRARHGRLTLDAFKKVSFSTDDAEAVGDLLANLRHLCDRRQIDWWAATQRAEGYYREETAATKGGA